MRRCSEKAYAMCPTRYLCGPIEESVFTDDSEYAVFNRSVEDKPMTNADRIRSMTDEELAKILGDKCICPPTSECANLCGDCVACWLEWLQQPD